MYNANNAEGKNKPNLNLVEYNEESYEGEKKKSNVKEMIV